VTDGGSTLPGQHAATASLDDGNRSGATTCFVGRCSLTHRLGHSARKEGTHGGLHGGHRSGGASTFVRIAACKESSSSRLQDGRGAVTLQGGDLPAG